MKSSHIHTKLSPLCCTVAQLLVLFVVFIPVSNHASAQNATATEFVIQDIERIRIRDEIQRHVSDTAEKTLSLSNLKDSRKPIVQLDISIDKKKLQSDFERYQQRQKAREQEQTQQQWRESTTRFLEFLKAVKELQSNDANTATKKSTPPAETTSQRFGILNISPNTPAPNANTQETAGQKTSTALSPSINFSAPAASYQSLPFSYSLLEYVSEIIITIHVPGELKTEARDELRKTITKLLAFPFLTEQNAAEKIKINDLPVLASDATANANENSWLKDFLSPKNQSLSGLLMSVAALLGFMLVGLTVILSGRKLADAVKNLAQVSLNKSQDGGDDKDSPAAASEDAPAAIAELAQGGSAGGSGSGRSKFSADKEADLLSQTRNQINENLSQWCKKDPVTVGEVLVDLTNSQDGMGTLNSLMLYSGYDNLKPALELLPVKLLRKLDESLNESWKDGAELLPGLEAAQLLLAGMIPRQTALLRFGYDTSAIRKSLLKLDLSTTKDLLNELSPADACTVFRMLPQGTALSVSESLGSDKLKEIMENLGNSDANQPPSDALMQKINERKENVSSQSVADKERLIRGLLKTSKQGNENRILEFLGGGDLLLRFELLQERFFLKDLEFVEPALIKTIIDKFTLARKANFLYFSEPSIRQSVLDLYPKDSKILETLVEELENIDKSPKRKNAAKNDKTESLNAVTGKILEMLRGDLTLRIALIEKIAKAMNVSLPNEIVSLARDVKESAA